MRKTSSWTDLLLRGGWGMRALWSMGILLSAAVAERGPDARLWSETSALAESLHVEKNRLNQLQGEIEMLRFAREDLRDLLLIPESVRRWGGKAELEFDRSLDVLEKAGLADEDAARELARGLEDALFVAQEMVQDKPNRDMLELLGRNRMQRQAHGSALRMEFHKPGGRWDQILSLANQIQGACHIVLSPDGKSAAGDSAQNRFHRNWHLFKDSLVSRGDKADWEKMARIDLVRIQGRLNARSRVWSLENLENVSRRYGGKISIGQIDHSLGESRLATGQFLEAVTAFRRVGPESRLRARSQLGILRAFFAGAFHDSVRTFYPGIRRELPGALQSPARYLVVQSLYLLGADSAVGEEAVLESGRDALSKKTLLVYAKSLVRSGRKTEARQILSGIAAESQLEPSQRRKAGLMLAHLNYEEEHFEAALRGYRSFLEDTTVGAEALFGMVWCNIRLGDLEGAEFVLKKLIAQHPDDAFAIEGFMVFIRKLLLKAREEWDYRQQVEGHVNMLREIQTKLKTASVTDREDSSAVELRKRVEKASIAMANAEPMSIDDLAALYRQALDLSEFVAERYRGGEFSQVDFRGDREKVLATLRRLAEGGEIPVEENESVQRREILRKLSSIRALSLEIHLLHKVWLEELLRYTQIGLNREISAATSDSARHGLQLKSRRVAEGMSERLSAKSAEILRRVRELERDTAASALEDWLLFQKGYFLFLESEDAEKRRFALNRLTEAEVAGEVGTAFEKPWLELIRRFPTSDHVPACLYYLGYSRAARGESEAGLREFEELAGRFPSSPYADQALIFIGEHYFNANDLPRAESAFDRVLDHPDSKYFDQALYKLAWTRYRASAYKPAISSFTYILEESHRKSKSGEGNILDRESMQYAALSLAESDTTGDGGFEQSQAFGKKLGDPRIGAKLLHRMAGVYLQQGRVERAKRALESLINGYPGYEDMPQAVMELAQAYDKGQNFGLGAETREKVIPQFGPGSEWYRGLKDPAVRATADSMVEKAVDEAARHYLYEAKRLVTGTADQRKRLYLKGIADYERLLSAYPGHPRAAKYSYQQAEAYYAMDDFAGAARKYFQVANDGRAGKLGVTAAYNAIVAAQELLRKVEGDASR